jgi:hemoglobin
MSSGSQTLYDRMGGEQGVEKLLLTFYSRVLADPELKPFFAKTAMEKLLRMQHELFGAALGGPHTYDAKDLARVRAGRRMTPRHFHLFRQYLLTTLQESGVSDDDIRQVVRAITKYQKDVVV